MEIIPIFRDRRDAGERLGDALKQSVREDHALVLALPRGGVPVAMGVARALNAELDVFPVRKLGVPAHEELAFGAVASGGIRVLNRQVIDSLQIPAGKIEDILRRESAELARREDLYREGPPADPHNRVVVVVDDGLATGASMLAALRAIRERVPERLIAAVPIASQEACKQIGAEAREVVCLATPDPFFSVGAWYENFSQIADDDVRRMLGAARQRSPQTR